MSILTTIIAVIVFFVILIIPHEAGHFMAARMMGVRVNEFSFGMGPAIFQRQGVETLYSIRLLPIGGYCALEGENEDTGDPRAFNSKPGWKKIVILVAGVTMNMLTAVIIMTGIFFYAGYATLTIDQVTPGSPAEKAGIIHGDTITAAEYESKGRVEIDNWDDLTGFNADHKDGYTLYADRNGGEVSFNVRPEKKGDRYLIGITPVVKRDLIMAVKSGVLGTGRMVAMIFDGFRMLFTGEASVNELSGPVGIVTAVNESAAHGIIYYLMLTALMCVNLAIINILPFPALDGGRILFVIIRKVTGRMISDELEARIHMIGMVILLALIVLITFKDVNSLIIK